MQNGTGWRLGGEGRHSRPFHRATFISTAAAVRETPGFPSEAVQPPCPFGPLAGSCLVAAEADTRVLSLGCD